MQKKMTSAALTLMAVTFVTSTVVSSAEAAVQFSGIEAPKTDAEKRKIISTQSITLDGKQYSTGYNVLMRSGDKVGDGTFGLLLDEKGKPVVNKDGSTHISVDNDFSSLLTRKGPNGDKLYMVSHFESRPGAMYITELQQADDGKLMAINTKNIDFSTYGGLWVPCAGSVTPWGTHLGGEEYPNNARVTEEAKSMDQIEDYDKPMARYFGVDPYAAETTVDTFRNAFHPYRYGYATEIFVTDDGKATAKKHFSMGREAVELAYVMPDQKTVYISDDGTNVGLFMFIADKAGDLSAGTLYAAKWKQTSDENGGAADLGWVDLGHANDAEIQEEIEGGVKFSDIWNIAAMKEDGSCEQGFTPINTTDGAECVQLKPGMEKIASRVETRRYAAYKGATTEFRKEEGITFDPTSSTLYVAMSEVAKGMEDGDKEDKGGPNDIRLPKNKCGTVYGLSIGPDAIIGSEYVAHTMKGVVSGIPHKYKDGDWAGSTCQIDGLANPDNITFMVGEGTLIIGEDTGDGHQNDAIWAYSVKEDKLTRILTTPYGSETTSPYLYPNVGGHGYLITVVQHPYGESDEDKLSDPADAMAYTGYFVLPAWKK